MLRLRSGVTQCSTILPCGSSFGVECTQGTLYDPLLLDRSPGLLCPTGRNGTALKPFVQDIGIFLARKCRCHNPTADQQRE